MLRRLLYNEDGQDLVEYTLLVAFVVVASAALWYYPKEATRNIISSVTEIVSRAGS